MSRAEVARRWGVSKRTVDRRRELGLLAWLDLAQGRGGRPQVRFRVEDVVHFEEQARLSLMSPVHIDGVVEAEMRRIEEARGISGDKH